MVCMKIFKVPRTYTHVSTVKDDARLNADRDTIGIGIGIGI